MDQKDIKKKLIKYGFTANQSKVYLSGLQLGTRTVTAIARHTNMHRVATYNVLQELLKKGFVTCNHQKNTGYYTMADPQFLRQKIQNQLIRFDNLLPELEAIRYQENKAFDIQVYQGLEGIKSLYTELLNSQTDFQAFLGTDHIDPILKERLYEIYLPQRIKKKIQSRAITSASKSDQYFANPQKVPLTQVCMIPEDILTIECEMVLFDKNKILITAMSTDELSGMLIQSTNLHTSRSSIFEILRKIYKSD